MAHGLLTRCCILNLNNRFWFSALTRNCIFGINFIALGLRLLSTMLVYDPGCCLAASLTSCIAQEVFVYCLMKKDITLCLKNKYFLGKIS